jgi:hypothetical protein
MRWTEPSIKHNTELMIRRTKREKEKGTAENCSMYWWRMSLNARLDENTEAPFMISTEY